MAIKKLDKTKFSCIDVFDVSGLTCIHVFDVSGPTCKFIMILCTVVS